jgi:hypothetical protein
MPRSRVNLVVLCSVRRRLTRTRHRRIRKILGHGIGHLPLKSIGLAGAAELRVFVGPKGVFVVLQGFFVSICRCCCSCYGERLERVMSVTLQAGERPSQASER